MQLTELRDRLLLLLQDPQGDVVAALSDLDPIINDMYVELVTEAEQAGGALWNVSDTVPVVTIPSTRVREYDLEASSDVSPLVGGSDPALRKVVDCTRTDLEIPYTVPIVSFSQRNSWLGRPSQRLGQVSRSGVYFFRKHVGGDPHWFIGFVEVKPNPGFTYEVRYAPEIAALSDGTDEPIQLPTRWHYLIAYGAAVTMKMTESRDTSGLAALYAKGLAEMRLDLASLLESPRIKAL